MHRAGRGRRRKRWPRWKVGERRKNVYQDLQDVTSLESVYDVYVTSLFGTSCDRPAVTGISRTVTLVLVPSDLSRQDLGGGTTLPGTPGHRR